MISEGQSEERGNGECMGLSPDTMESGTPSHGSPQITRQGLSPYLSKTGRDT